MKPEDILPVLSIGECIEIQTENSLHIGFFVEVKNTAHIPRVYIAVSKKFVHQPIEKQCFDHIISIDTDKVRDIWIHKLWNLEKKEVDK